jgi:hypothetical protein
MICGCRSRSASGAGQTAALASPEVWPSEAFLGFRPKKRGPDQRVPVIARAICDSDRYCACCHRKPSSQTTTS